MDYSSLRIMVVDDDPMQRTYITRVLGLIGVQHIQESGDGTSALIALTNFQPDLILTDVHMKPMDGLAFVQKLRNHANAQMSKTRVVFMSADSSPQTVGSAVHLNIAGYIVKPPRLEDLKAKIAQAMAHN